MRDKLINKKLVCITRGDGNVEYRIRYQFKKLFGSYWLEDELVFDNEHEANIFYNISVYPSEKIEKSTWIDRRIYTAYDDALAKYSVTDYNRYNNDKVGYEDVYLIYYCKNIPASITYDYDSFELNMLDESTILYMNNKASFEEPSKFLLVGPRRAINKYNYQFGSVYGEAYDLEGKFIQPRRYPIKRIDELFDGNPASTNTETNIIRFIEHQKMLLKKSMEEHNRKEHEKTLHETIVSCEEVHSNNEPMKTTTLLEVELEDMKLKGLYKERNKLIQDELKRIDEHKQMLLSLLH